MFPCPLRPWVSGRGCGVWSLPRQRNLDFGNGAGQLCRQLTWRAALQVFRKYTVQKVRRGAEWVPENISRWKRPIPAHIGIGFLGWHPANFGLPWPIVLCALCNGGIKEQLKAFMHLKGMAQELNTEPTHCKAFDCHKYELVFKIDPWGWLSDRVKVLRLGWTPVPCQPMATHEGEVAGQTQLLILYPNLLSGRKTG